MDGSEGKEGNKSLIESGNVRYSDHSVRGTGYAPANYTSEFDMIKQDILSQVTLPQPTNFLIGPSVCCQVAGFELEDVFNSGWLSDNLNSLAQVAVQQ